VLFPNGHLLTPGIGFAIVLSSVAHAQIAAPPGDKKSDEIGTLLDGEAYMFGKDMQLHKSNVKMTNGQHQAALKKGARELRPRVVIYRWADKLYMMENIGRNAAVNYEDQFILDP
jgi:hypothetical protein